MKNFSPCATRPVALPSETSLLISPVILTAPFAYTEIELAETAVPTIKSTAGTVMV